MQAMGKLGSYIGRSVYTVSGPFHPFGGAVDIIVVEQPDGTYKSSPWYVRFGKFQGVLKTREKVVRISVNGVEAGFHMFLDHKGEAFFLKEVDLEEGDSLRSPPSSSDDSSTGNERNGAVGTMARTNSRRAKLLGLVFGRKSRKEEIVQQEGSEHVCIRTASLDRAEIAADLLDLKWSTNLVSSRLKKENASRLGEDKGNETFSSDNHGFDDAGLVYDKNNHKLESTVDENVVGVKCSDSEFVVETATSIESVNENASLSNSEPTETDKLGYPKSDFQVNSVSIISEVSKSNSKIVESVERHDCLLDSSVPKEDNSEDSIQSIYYSKVSEIAEVGLVQSIEKRSESFCRGGCGETCVHTEAVQNIVLKAEPGRDAVHSLDPLNIQEFSRNGDQLSFLHEETMSMTGGTIYGTSGSSVTECFSQSITVHQSNDSLEVLDPLSATIVSVPDLSNSFPGGQKTYLSNILGSGISQEEQLLFGNLDDFGPTDGKPWKFNCADHEAKDSDFSLSSTVTGGTLQEGRSSIFSLEQSVIDDYINDVHSSRRSSISISSDVGISKTGHARPKEFIRMVKSLPAMELDNNSFEASGLEDSLNISSCPDAKPSIKNHRHSSSDLVGKNGPANPFHGKLPSSGESFGRSRRGWPFSFKRSRTIRSCDMDVMGSGKRSEVMISNNGYVLEGGNDVGKAKKKVLKTLTPTSEQLASLNLREGLNKVVFTFSTAMLGNQQVDARIFLWRWDTRIVISDVDGTITRSDLLGQVMPLVGMDWSQTGVAHLFSAIKENGYQLLFLSARSISQSFHTRQFLCNIRQDGKALPEGPVVISPDGLFPSLFREVVRRTPHEFKISCLEDIKALFPADRNPFYAGFGNRDTDEFSYLKVGIPRGKIFTINPRGEIVVNRHVHTKSYTSLHSLVHGMFPTMTSFEQEDYNSWNYWKLPPPLIDI